MATTQRMELEITGFSNNRPTFKAKGKRKQYYLPTLTESTLIFEGWDLPIKTDSDVSKQDGIFTSSITRGNACLNLTGPKDLIEYYVLKKNLNDAFTRLDEVIWIDGEREVPVFPTVQTNHAVVERIRATQ